MREFLFVDDLAAAVVHAMENKLDENHLYNVGTGNDVTIKDISQKHTKNNWAQG